MLTPRVRAREKRKANKLALCESEYVRICRQHAGLTNNAWQQHNDRHPSMATKCQNDSYAGAQLSGVHFLTVVALYSGTSFSFSFVIVVVSNMKNRTLLAVKIMSCWRKSNVGAQTHAQAPTSAPKNCEISKNCGNTMWQRIAIFL